MEKREKFSSNLAIFFATLGSAVGLGNIWKFPYLVGVNGGGAFVLVYLICVVLVGIPIMVSEFYMGRKTRSNVVGVFAKLEVSPYWKIIGYLGVLSAFLIMFFYSSVAGWVYSYVFKAIKGDFALIASLPIGEATNIVVNQFEATINGSLSPILWQLIVLATVSTILIAGVKNGIEKLTKTLMPVLFVLIVICCIRALTLDGAREGIKFLFAVDLSKLKPSVILAALGLSFFKLSLGMGTMTTYASYFTDDTNLIQTSAKVAFSDTLVSLLAGVAIFPVVFTFGLEAGSGPGLLFNTIPLVFSRIPLGNILLIAFFVLTSIAATTAMISIVEVPVAFFMEQFNLSRKSSVVMTSAIIFSISLFTVHKTSLLGNVSLFGKSFFDLFDYISSNIAMPIGGLLMAIFVGYVISRESLEKEVSNNNSLNNNFAINLYISILKYITPALLIIIFLNALGIIG